VRIDVDGGGYDSASEALFNANYLASSYYTSLTGELGGYGGMAGDDSTSTEFAAEYDSAAAEVVGAVDELVDALATVGILAKTSIENHRKANAASVFNKPRPMFDSPSARAGEGPVDVPAYTPPTALGGNPSDTPDFWDEIVAHLEGFAWPNGDVGRLREASSTWSSAATDMDRLTSYVDTAISALGVQRSPEIPAATEALRELKSLIKDVSAACRDLSSSCSGYAQQIEDHRDAIEDIVRDMAIEAGVSLVAGAIVGFFSFGGGAAAGTAIAGWRIASAARRILSTLRKLKSVVKLAAVAKLTKVVSKVKPLRASLQRFRKARKVDDAADATTPPKPPKRTPGDRLPDSDRPGDAGDDWQGRVSDNGEGEVWQKPGTPETGPLKNANQLRLGGPTDRYPDGYVRFYNEHGQPIGLDGKPNIPGATKAENAAHTHIPKNPDGTYPVPQGWNP